MLALNSQTSSSPSATTSGNQHVPVQTIPVVILCGGMGTRLREETEFKPKPMVEIGGRPILWHIMKHYAHYGFRRFVLCLGYKGHVIKDYLLNYDALTSNCTFRLGARRSVSVDTCDKDLDIEVVAVDTGLHTLTGGRLHMVRPHISGELFMVTYGDGVSDVDLAELLRFHRRHGKAVTLTAVRPPSRYGILDLAADGAVREFREKARTDWINGGFFVCDRTVFDYLGPDAVLEQAPLQNLAQAGNVMAFRHDGFWLGMDTYREFVLLNELWDSGERPWKVW